MSALKATLIIPALNEAEAIGPLLRRVPRETVAEVTGEVEGCVRALLRELAALGTPIEE